MRNDLEQQLQLRPKSVQLDESGGKSIPIEKVYDILDYLFGWDNWSLEIMSFSRSFDKLDVVVSLTINFGNHTVREDGSSTLVTKAPNKDSERTDAKDMDLPKAVAYATKNAAAKFGKKLGRALNKDASEQKAEQHPQIQLPKKDKAKAAITELKNLIEKKEIVKDEALNKD